MKQRRTRAAQQRELSARCATNFGGNAGCGVRLVI
jgi:hypothetical protein